jgi:sugar lactone lactonase YvrE
MHAGILYHVICTFLFLSHFSFLMHSSLLQPPLSAAKQSKSIALPCTIRAPNNLTLTTPGSLFRFSSDLTRTTLKTGLKIPNSIGWSPDHKTLYFVRTTSNKILAYDFSPSGSISNERVFYTHPGPGSPDGFRIDEEGYVWQAIYGEGRVIRIDGNGEVVAEVKYPTRAITCPVFVGTELWVTTAGEEDEKEVESKRYGGAVFKVDVGVRGAREFEFKLER